MKPSNDGEVHRDRTSLLRGLSVRKLPEGSETGRMLFMSDVVVTS